MLQLKPLKAHWESDRISKGAVYPVDFDHISVSVSDTLSKVMVYLMYFDSICIKLLYQK